jgi:ABC-2 type transport system permease protein
MPNLWRRITALMQKECLQLLRDRTTLSMLIGVPLLQILLFGCAIEYAPHGLPLIIVASPAEHDSQLARRISANPIFSSVRTDLSRQAADAALRDGRAVLVVDATDRPIRVLIDATDPVLGAFAQNAIEELAKSMGNADLQDTPDVIIEKRFNPSASTRAYIVPGLLGVILTMTLVMMSALTVARERERGTLEALQLFGVRSVELWAGKLAPYLIFGLLQGGLILIVAYTAFDIQVRSGLLLLLTATVGFACANLALGFLFSCLARQQMQAMQMTFFFFLPSSLLSGFMFPFIAMPDWARTIGAALPLTHFLRIVRGLTLRGVDFAYVAHEIVPILCFAVLVSAVALLVPKQ